MHGGETPNDGSALVETLEGASGESNETPLISALRADKQIVGRAAMAAIHETQTNGTSTTQCGPTQCFLYSLKTLLSTSLIQQLLQPDSVCRDQGTGQQTLNSLHTKPPAEHASKPRLKNQHTLRGNRHLVILTRPHAAEPNKPTQGQKNHPEADGENEDTGGPTNRSNENTGPRTLKAPDHKPESFGKQNKKQIKGQKLPLFTSCNLSRHTQRIPSSIWNFCNQKRTKSRWRARERERERERALELEQTQQLLTLQISLMPPQQQQQQQQPQTPTPLHLASIELLPMCDGVCLCVSVSILLSSSFSCAQTLVLCLHWSCCHEEHCLRELFPLLVVCLCFSRH